MDKKKGSGGGEKKKLISEMGGVNLNMKGGVRDGHAVGHGADMREAIKAPAPAVAAPQHAVYEDDDEPPPL